MGVLLAIMGRTACRRLQFLPVRGCVADQPQQYIPKCLRLPKTAANVHSLSVPPCLGGQSRFPKKHVFCQTNPTSFNKTGLFEKLNPITNPIPPRFVDQLIRPGSAAMSPPSHNPHVRSKSIRPRHERLRLTATSQPLSLRQFQL